MNITELKIKARANAIMNKKDILAGAFPQQRSFIEDTAKLKALFCTRRAAKSYTAGLYMVKEARENPRCNCLFIALTRESAKNIMWKDILQQINRDFNLNAEFNKTLLTMTLPNGSMIRLTGVDVDEDEMNKLLGGKYRLVCVDEASMFSINVRNLVYGILKPAVADPNAKGERGIICLFGTASNLTRGLFHDITSGSEPGWSLHKWAAMDNPYVAKQWEEELEEIRTKRPLYMETPQFRQWYLNEWVVDEEKLVYRFNPDRNLFGALPRELYPSGWVYTLGVDTGWEDANSFVLSANHVNDPTLYILKTFKKNKMTFDQVADKVQEFMNSKTQAPTRVVIDGANKQGVESMRVRTGIPFEFAEKTGKVDFIEMLNADLIQAKVKICEKDCEELINELKSLVWVTDGDRIALPKKEHPALPNHTTDAFLYNWRYCFHYHAAPADLKLVKYSKDWIKKQEPDWEAERERMVQNNDWPSDGEFGKLGFEGL